MMHVFKRGAALFLAVMMMVGLTACGEKAGTKNNTTEAAKTTSEAATEDTTEESTEVTEAETEENYDGVLVSEGMMELDYAEGFSVELFKGGYRLLTIGSNDNKILMVPEGMSVPEGLAGDVWSLQMPVDNIFIASTGMVSLLDAIGAVDKVKLVSTKADDWYIDSVLEKMNEGSIRYVGKYSEPDYEMITGDSVQLHVNSTRLEKYPEVTEKFATLGIPTIIDESTRETNPLARVEWVKLFGVIFGMEEETNAYFESQKAMVEAVAASEPVGITFGMANLSSDKFYAYTQDHYIVQMMEMVGGTYTFEAEDASSTTINTTFEDWYLAFKDVDYLIINYSPSIESIDDLLGYNALIADFKSVKEGHVYVTSPDFTQSTAAIATIIEDMHEILTTGESTDYLMHLE